MSSNLCREFEGHDRFAFPEGIYRVTGGDGGEAVLITKYEKSILVDCGMAYCGPQTVLNIKEILGDRTLDYVFATHSHYDHIGAMPFILDAYPDAIVFGSAKCQHVFSREGARKVIKNLGEEARDFLSDSKIEIPVDILRIDQVVEDGEKVDIGGGEMVCLETKGHTDCCMTFVLEPDSVMFTCESTGVLEGEHEVHAEILKSFDDAMESARKCRTYGAKYIVTPHFGLIPEYFNETFFDRFEEFSNMILKMVKGFYADGYTDEQVLDEYVKLYWSEERASEQPIEAFMANAKPMLKVLKEA